MILNGKELSDKLKLDLKDKISKLTHTRKPGLAVVLVGNDPASNTYVKNKELACKSVGINSYTYKLDENATKEEVIKVIDKLNYDNNVDGILIQLPLPKHLNEHELLNTISKDKDVDGFSTINQGLLFQKKMVLLPQHQKGL